MQAAIVPQSGRTDACPHLVPYREQSSQFFVSMAAQAFYCADAASAVVGDRDYLAIADFEREDRAVELWGTNALSVEDNKKGESRPKKSARSAKVLGRKSIAEDGNVGNALRSVYQQTVNEDVPREFLDLLGKLT